MKDYRTIIVAVDFSTGSRSALEEAARLAALHGGKLHVLHVVDSLAVAAMQDSHGGLYEGQAEVAAEGARAALTRWLAQSKMPADATATVVVGVPLHEILEHARALQAELLVAGVIGAGGVAAGAGSVASKLARKAPVRVLLVSAHAPLVFRKIVACIDFSDASREVAAEAVRLAAMEDAQVEFLHVWYEPWLVMSYDAPVADATTKFRDSYIQDLRQELHDFVADKARGSKFEEVMINGSNHGNVIAAHAKETGADLIIVGGRGRTNLKYMLLGSTAERLLIHLPCSLLVVKEVEE